MRPSSMSIETLHARGKSSGWKRKAGTSRLFNSSMTASACSSWSLVTISTVSGIVHTPKRWRREWRAGTGSCSPSLRRVVTKDPAASGDDVVDDEVGVHVDLDAEDV